MTRPTVTCPTCGQTFAGAGAAGTIIPGHGTGWVSCPGSYRKAEEA